MPSFALHQTVEFAAQLEHLRTSPDLEKRYRAVCKCIRLLADNPRHPGLNAHKFSSLSGANQEEVWEVYAENKTAGAYRVFWHYGPGRALITLIAVTPHP